MSIQSGDSSSGADLIISCSINSDGNCPSANCRGGFATLHSECLIGIRDPLSLVAQPGMTHRLPTQFNDATNTIIENIDVLWLDDNAIAAAFEVERTTAIYSGLLRMSDLLVMQPNVDIPIYLVAPEARREKGLREVNWAAFKGLRTKRPFSRVCRLITFEGLRESVRANATLLPYLRAAWVHDELSESCEQDDA